MKKIFIIVCLILVIFQMVVLATAIDIGNAATNRWYTLGVFTVVDKSNPANASGTITNVEIWAVTGQNLSNCEVATFYVVSGNNLSTRDYVTIGSVTAGSKQTFTVDSEGNPISLDVEEGDYIGMYYSNGQMEIDQTGYTGIWYLSNIDSIPCTNTTFNSIAGYAISLYGTGATVEAGANILFIFQNF